MAEIAAAAVCIVAYVEVAPASAEPALACIAAYGESCRAATGCNGVTPLQRLNYPHHFAILEVWQDDEAQKIHAAAPATTEFHAALDRLLIAPHDQRRHEMLSVAAGADGNRDSVYAVTHVDLVPPCKDEGIELIGHMAVLSREEAGNMRFEAWAQSNRGNHITLVEAWQDETAQAEHTLATHVQIFRNSLLPLSGSLYDERLYREIH